MNRYARQMILPEVGPEGQARISAARVLVVGAGGLAAGLLPLLAGAGVGHLTIVDGDRVEMSNLHRQHLFCETDCGGFKAAAAAARCRAINVEVLVEAITANLTPANVEALVRDHDFVVDCADSYAVSYTLSDACRAAGSGLVTASVLGFGGYVAGVCGSAPSLRAVFPQAPESAASCATAGVMGPVVSMLGAMQAQMVLSALLRLEPSPFGQVFQLDGRTWRSTSFRFDGAPEPAHHFAFVAPSELTDEDTIVDLRSAEEAPAMLHRSAKRALPDGAPDAGRLALCCASGLRAWRMAETLNETWPGEIVLVAASAS